MSEQPFNGKKLFIVEIEQSIMVMAKDRDDAELVAKDVIREIDWHESYFTCREGFLAGWENSIPFGDHDDQTCSEIREAIKEYERTRTLTKAELEAMGQVPLIPEILRSQGEAE